MSEVESFLGGWLTASQDDPTEFDRELDDDARRRRGDGLPDGRGGFRTRLATGTGQFDLHSGEPAPSGRQLDDPLSEAAATPISRIMAHKVACVRADMDASEARSRILSRSVSGLPVVDNWGRAVGMISKTDLVEQEITSARSGRSVADVMTPLVFALQPDDSISRAAALMAYEGVHRIVVTDRSGYVVGLVSALDIARWLGWNAGHPVGRDL